ncbi:MAG: hypothetical protein J6W31_06980 [Clostridia bacterium]|nr:hypothetical protein [Clostridia bacterium]
MNDYKSLKKTKNSIFSVLIALLLLFEACALVMLGSRLTFFAEKPASNIFSLIQSDARTTVRKGYIDTDGTMVFPEASLALPKVPGALAAFRPLDESIEGEVPGYQVSDANTVWQGVTDVEIFKISYENGEEKITVDGGTDKVIAPGTANQYSFTLDNSGTFALDYTLTMKAFFGNEEYAIPVTARLRTAEGNYAVGSEESFEDVLELNRVNCEATLGAGRQATYVLDWQWDFEGDDVYDTLLGNLAADGKELSLTIVIETVATQCSDPDNSSGDLPPTGDDNSTFVWLLAAILAFAGIYIVLMAKKRRPIDDQL